MGNVLYTIGHSNQSSEQFVECLIQHRVTAVADVRSHPFSRHSPHFNSNALRRDLGERGIKYVYLGAELGARRVEAECYVGQQVQFRLVMESPLFQTGLNRLARGLEAHRIALLCAEKDPITCHRMILICHALRRTGQSILHIHGDGSLETNVDAERRLVKATGLAEFDLFASFEDQVVEAYHRQGQRIAWVFSPHQSDISAENEQ